MNGKSLIFAFGYGLLFGLGLIVAGMTNPAKVKAFLDVGGDWDPSLAFVMLSALLVLGVAQRLWIKTEAEDNETNTCGGDPGLLDARLILGAVLFGVGWGISGICPGPALVGLSSGLGGSYVFIAALFAGFALFRFWNKS